MFKVYIIESERDWGAKLVETKEFETKELAYGFVVEFNKTNDKPEVPDWYMYATTIEPGAHVSRRG